jgi:carbon-monoxide dehydrogenase large subunit
MSTTADADAGHATGGAGRFVGQSVKRREDPRLLTGRGNYVGDVLLPGTVHAAFLRSDVARGRIVSIDTTAARALPGVRAVYTAADLNPGAGPLWTTTSGPDEAAPPDRPLAEGDVKFVGDLLAIVVADNRYLAEDGCDLIEVDIEALPAVVGPGAVDAADLVHPELGTNVAYTMTEAPDPELDEILASAAHVLTRTFKMARNTNVPMEGRGLLASWDPYARTMTVYPSSQSPHEIKAFTSRLLALPQHQVHVLMADVGGGFGQKMYMTRDEACVLLASYRLGKPVKWIEDRRENLIAANQARADAMTVTMALDEEGHILATKCHLMEELGTYPLPGTNGTAMLSAMMSSGPYKMGKFAMTAVAYYTNTCPKAPFRGPWAIETIAREQMMDVAARELGLDPLELRLRNVVRQEDLPYTLPSGLAYDIVSAHETLEQVTNELGWEAFRGRQREAREQGRYLGVGLGLCIEPSAVAFGLLASEQATIRMDISGKVLVLMGTGSHGHSLETTIPQVVADHLGCSFDDVIFSQGDTDATPYGAGTGGSRSAVIAGGAATVAAGRLKEKLLPLAAHLLEAASEDIEVADSKAFVRGTPSRSVSFSELATTAYADPFALPPGVEAGLSADARYAPPGPFTWSNACHLCVCQVDIETGSVALERYLVSEDCGVMINPMVVEGQIAGGVVQGIGNVLYEEMAYDGAGNPLATTFLDYLVPTTTEVPTIECFHIETPSNALGGYKGMGEGGAIASPPAVANAIADALAPLGVSITDFPLGPSQLRALIRQAQASAPA